MTFVFNYKLSQKYLKCRSPHEVRALFVGDCALTSCGLAASERRQTPFSIFEIASNIFHFSSTGCFCLNKIVSKLIDITDVFRHEIGKRNDKFAFASIFDG